MDPTAFLYDSSERPPSLRMQPDTAWPVLKHARNSCWGVAETSPKVRFQQISILSLFFFFTMSMFVAACFLLRLLFDTYVREKSANFLVAREIKRLMNCCKTSNMSARKVILTAYNDVRSKGECHIAFKNASVMKLVTSILPWSSACVTLQSLNTTCAC